MCNIVYIYNSVAVYIALYDSFLLAAVRNIERLCAFSYTAVWINSLYRQCVCACIICCKIVCIVRWSLYSCTVYRKLVSNIAMVVVWLCFKLECCANRLRWALVCAKVYFKLCLLNLCIREDLAKSCKRNCNVVYILFFVWSRRIVAVFSICNIKHWGVVWKCIHTRSTVCENLHCANALSFYIISVDTECRVRNSNLVNITVVFLVAEFKEINPIWVRVSVVA